MKSLSLTEAKALADQWADQKQASERDDALSSYFADADPDDLIRMWETGYNLEGGKLSNFEGHALVNAWLQVFGSCPPDKQ